MATKTGKVKTKVQLETEASTLLYCTLVLSAILLPAIRTKHGWRNGGVVVRDFDQTVHWEIQGQWFKA